MAIASEEAERVEAERVEAAVRLLATTDLSTCGHGELDVLSGALQRVRGFVSAHDVRIARRREEVHAAAAAGTAPSERPGVPAGGPATLDGAPLDLTGFAGGHDRRPGREAERDRTRAQVCTVLPMFEQALAAGRIDAAHVDAVAAAWRDLDDAERTQLARHASTLLACATVEPAERFRRRVRDLARQIARDHGVRVAERQRAAQQVRRWIDGRTGMGHLHAELDPESTARVWAALDQHLGAVAGRDDTAGVPPTRLEVDALVELVTASAALDPRSPELCVLVDLRTLETGVFGPGSVAETSDGRPLTPAAVRRLACEAGIVPIVLGGDGVPIDVGRARRLATREQRRALAAMYATCALPGCDVRFDRCRIHHVQPWLPTGPTDLANLLPVCTRHHHLVHEGGWLLTCTPDRVITLRSPDGTVRFHGDTRDRVPATGPHSDDAGAALDGPPIDDDPWAGPAMVERRLVDAAVARVAALSRRRCRTQPDPEASAESTTTRPRRGP